MAVCWLIGAVLLAAIGGFLQGRQSVVFVYLSLPFALGAVVAHVVAARWPLRDGPSPGRPWRVVNAARVLLGIVVGILGFGAGGGYGTMHQAWFGERVSAEVTDSRRGCSVNSARCYFEYRLTAGGEDLGWVSLCGAPGRVGGPVQVDVDPLGWVPPLAATCTTVRETAPMVTRWWLGGVGAVAVVIVVNLSWRGGRSVMARRAAGTDRG